MMNGFRHAFFQITVLVPVTEFPGLMLAGAGSTGNSGPAPGSIFKPDVHFDSGISTTIEDFPTVYVSDRGHVMFLSRSGNYRSSNPASHCYRWEGN